MTPLLLVLSRPSGRRANEISIGIGFAHRDCGDTPTHGGWPDAVPREKVIPVGRWNVAHDLSRLREDLTLFKAFELSLQHRNLVFDFGYLFLPERLRGWRFSAGRNQGEYPKKQHWEKKVSNKGVYRA